MAKIHILLLSPLFSGRSPPLRRNKVHKNRRTPQPIPFKLYKGDSVPTPPAAAVIVYKPFRFSPIRHSPSLTRPIFSIIIMIIRSGPCPL